MEQPRVQYRSVAQRLVLASIGMLAVVLLLISVAMSAIAERQSRERIVASVAEKAQSVANSVDALDSTARALVERSFGPFRETFDPVLVLDDESTIFDSRVIVEYLDNASPGNRLIPGEKRSRIQARRWEALADGCTDAAAAIIMDTA